jgi:predicted DNA-binding protein (UPF0251 family)
MASATSQASLDNSYYSALENFTISDVDELQKILAQIKSPHIRILMERDLAIARSKLVTRLVNDSIAVKSGKSHKKETRVIEEEVEVEVDDEEGYIEKHIKGFKQKARGIKNTLPDLNYNKIKDALIRCKGDEGEALDALLSESLPPRPKDMTRIKVIKKIQRTETVFVTEGGSSAPNAEKFVPDVTQEESATAENISERAQMIKKKISEEKDNSQKLIKEIEGYKKNNTDYTALQKMVTGDDGKGNRMYLPGEFDAMEKGECRLFTFKPERTFSNEVSHIHFRVAESEFYRLQTVKNVYRVTEVKYVVTPYLVQDFELARHDVAHTMRKTFKETKPLLLFHGLDNVEDEIEWVTQNNIRNVEEKGAFFANDATYASNFITGESGRIMFFLVLTGIATNATFTSKNNNVNQLKNKLGSAHTLKNDEQYLVFDKKLILPYYIVKYERFVPNVNHYDSGTTGVVRLDEEWKNIEVSAKADKFMNDVKQFYQQTLMSENKNKLEGVKKIEPLTPITASSDVSFEFDGSEVTDDGDEEGEEDDGSEVIDEEDEDDVDDDE